MKLLFLLATFIFSFHGKAQNTNNMALAINSACSVFNGSDKDTCNRIARTYDYGDGYGIGRMGLLLCNGVNYSSASKFEIAFCFESIAYEWSRISGQVYRACREFSYYSDRARCFNVHFSLQIIMEERERSDSN